MHEIAALLCAAGVSTPIDVSRYAADATANRRLARIAARMDLQAAAERAMVETGARIVIRNSPSR